MTPSIFDKELVQKYFGCPYTNPHTHDPGCEKWNANRILAAMQTPIRKRERYLFWDKDNPNWAEGRNECDDDFRPWHPHELRLPDAFQPAPEREIKSDCYHHPLNCKCKFIPPPEKCECWPRSNSLCPVHKPDAIEKQVKRILNLEWALSYPLLKETLKDELRALVRLAQGGGE